LNTNKNQKKYKFTLRDPNRYEPIHRNKYIFYFGKISLNLLTVTRRDDVEESILISEILTPFTDIGVKSQNESVNLKNYVFGKVSIGIIRFIDFL
jgi:hypothetical protein